MIEKIYLKIISYNNKGYKFGQILKFSGFGIGILVTVLGLINDQVKFVSESDIWKYMGVPGYMTAIFLGYIGSLKSGFHENKLTKIGQITIEMDHTYIKDNMGELELNNKDYKIEFFDRGYDGKSNWNPLLRTGALIKDSGINEIIFKNSENEIKYEILIDNSRQMDALKNIINQIRNNK